MDSRWLYVGVVAFALACGGTGGAGADGGDEEGARDAAGPVDASQPPMDAGPDDAGGTDAGALSDAGDLADAGNVDADAGAGVDGGEGPDAGGSTRPEVLWNGGFEQWDDVLPAAWLGLQSNLAAEGVEKVTGDVFEGLNACRLVNESGTHKRFTTAPVSARAGRYECRYQVRGHGEIRSARYDTDFSSYTPSGFHAIDDDAWSERTYDFTLAADVYDTFELIFSVRNTQADRGHLVIDDVACTRVPEPCDAVTCDAWARCDNTSAACVPRADRCADDAGCDAWERCDADHRCVPREGRCNATTECAVASPATPVCADHTCVTGDPCAGVSCTLPRTCQPATASCGLSPGACVTTADCTGALPACDAVTHQCVGADHAANVFPNGGFEAWDTYVVPYRGEHELPEAWYGLDIPGSSELDPARIHRYTAHVHGGTSAVQLIQPGTADRFTSEAFDLPAGRFTCSYRVRGHGTIRHRHYSTGGWSVLTPFVEVDSDAWTPVVFNVNGNVRDFRLILYPSFTQADRDHLQVDDVVCTKDG